MSEVDQARARPRPRSRLRVAFLLVALAFAVVAIASQWDEVSDRLGDLSAGPVAASIVFAVASLWCSFLAWRETLAGLGDRIGLRPAARIFYLAQLAKYVPGSIWSIVGQVELAKGIGIRRERTATAGIVVLVVSLAVGLVLAVLAVPAVLDADAGGYLWLLALLVPLAVVLRPTTLTWLVGTGLRVLKRPPLDGPLTATMVTRVSALSLLSNALLGLQIWALGVDIGLEPDASTTAWTLAPLAIGAYGIAAAISLVVIPLPAGAGLREAVLILLLAPQVGVAGATLVAVIARLTLTVADVAVAAVVAAATKPATSPAGQPH